MLDKVLFIMKEAKLSSFAFVSVCKHACAEMKMKLLFLHPNFQLLSLLQHTETKPQ